VRNSYGREGQRISLGDDEIFAYSSGDDSEDGHHERELEKTLDSWLSKDTLKAKKSELGLLKSMRKGDSMKSVHGAGAGAGASMKEQQLQIDRDLSRSLKEVESNVSVSVSKEADAKASAECKPSPRLEQKTRGQCHEDGEDFGQEEAGDDEEDNDEDNDEDEDEEEDGEVAGLQCLLAKALLSKEESEDKAKAKQGSRDDISL
jgi:hypothetical protein